MQYAQILLLMVKMKFRLRAAFLVGAASMAIFNSVSSTLDLTGGQLD
jgi:hypothetical protein